MRNRRAPEPIAAVLTVTLFFAAGCDGLLDVDPTEAVGADVAVETRSGVESQLAGVYHRLSRAPLYGSEILLLAELLADNARPSSPPEDYVGQALNAHGDHLGSWSEWYQMINTANFVIVGADGLTEEPASFRNRVRGEALFLRALAYFDLARIFGYEPNRALGDWDLGPVIRTEPTRSADDALPRARATVLETYEQVESDLVESIELLASDGADDVYFANQAAAEALLARVYLYWERWADAEDYASRALEHTSAVLAPSEDVPNMFARQPNPESLFEINYAPHETVWANDCMACFTQPGAVWFSVWAPEEIVDLFEPGDMRREHYGVTTGDEGEVPGAWYSKKWTQSVAEFTDNKPLIRYAEVLLIRAEARAEMGQQGPALQDLNTLRESRGLGPLPDGLSGADLIDEILLERRRELGFEGHRWFDLKRRGLDVPKPASSGLPPLPHDDYRILAPLPTNEVENNAELLQNPGY